MKLKLAIFKSPFGYDTAINEDRSKQEVYSDHTQLTEFVDVYFPELTKDVIIAQQVKIVDGLIEKAKQEAIEKMNELQQRKQELLALTQE